MRQIGMLRNEDDGKMRKGIFDKKSDFSRTGGRINRVMSEKRLCK